MNQLLLESKLASEFTFKFKLDGLVNGFMDDAIGTDLFDLFVNNFGTDEDDSPFKSNNTVYSFEGYTYFGNYNHYVYNVDGDQFVRYNVDSDEVQTSFTYNSPTLPFNIQSIQKIINVFKEAKQKDIFETNDNCRFNVSFSFPGITNEDSIWIISQLALDTEAQKLFKVFESDEISQDMSELYDSIDSQNLPNAIEQFNYKEIVNLLKNSNNDLVSLLRVGNNIDWKGPRNILNGMSTNEAIKFFKQVYQIVMWMGKALEAKEINGVSKENYMKGIIKVGGYKPLNNFDKIKGHELDDVTLNLLVNKIENNPSLLLNIASDSERRIIDQIIQKLYNKAMLGKIISKLEDAGNQMPQVVYDIAYKYIPAKMAFKASSEALEKTSNKTLKRLLSTRFGVSKADLAVAVEHILPYVKEEVYANDDVLLNTLVKYYTNIMANNLLTSDKIDNQIKTSIIETLFNNDNYKNYIDIINNVYDTLDDNMKSRLAQSIAKKIMVAPALIKYIDEIDNIMLVSILGYALRNNNLDEVKQILVKSGKVDPNRIAEMEKYFTRDYQFDDNIDNIFED